MGERLQIAVLDDFHHSWAKTDGVRRLREHGDVTIFTAPVNSPEELQTFDVLIANRERTRFDRSFIGALSGVRVLIQTGKHNPHIDFDAARDAGIAVLEVSGGYSVGAAELTIGLMFAVTRQIPGLDAAIRRGEWEPPSTPILNGKTLGIVGYGRIGAHVANIARAIGMRVIAWSRSLDGDKAAASGIEFRSLDDLLAEADIVSIHTALNAETRGLVDARRLGLMKPGAYLVNTARAAVVDQDALVNALESGRLAGAGLDVFDPEPLPQMHPFTGMSNVAMTPHIGWPTDDSYERFAGAACDALDNYLDSHGLD